MYRPRSLILGLLTLGACGENSSPTQPETEVDPAPAAATPAVASNTWTLKAAYPAVFGAIGVSAGVFPNAAGQSVVYTIGGTDGEGGSGVQVVAYNVATNTWTGKGSDTRVYVFNTNGVGKIGNKLYFSGGRDYGNGYDAIVGAVWAYDPAANTLTQKAGMPKATAEGITGVIDGKLYVLPGNCSYDNYPQPGYCETEPFRRLFRYNPATNYWATKRPAPHYHAHGAGGVINGKFFVAGGIDNLGNPVAALDRYDPATDTWKTLAPLPSAGSARGAVLQGKLFVVVSGATAHRAYAYNPTTNTWSPKAAPKFAHPALVQVTLGGTPRLLAIGGVRRVPDPPYTVPVESELYTP